MRVFGRVGPPRRHVGHDRGPGRIGGPCVSRGAQAGGVRPLPPPAARRCRGAVRPYAVPRRTRRRGDAVRGAAGPAVWGHRRVLALSAVGAATLRRYGAIDYGPKWHLRPALWRKRLSSQGDTSHHQQRTAQAPNGARDAWPTGSARPTLPAPIAPKPSSMPPENGVGLDDDERSPPSGPQVTEPRPEQPVNGPQPRAPAGLSLQDRSLMTKRRVLNLERRLALQA